MTRALVLSGGGSVGIAWQTGFAAGLGAEGVRLDEADLIVGTSAGSASGAQIALSFDMAKRVAAYRARAEDYRARKANQEGQDQSPGAGAGSGGLRRGRGRGGMAQLFQPGEQVSPEERRARIGRYALEAETAPEESFARGFRYLEGHGWPRRYMCTAVDAETGAFQVWDEAAGVDLVRAVASSCAVPGVYPPMTINGRRYIDGGMRSGTNADLAQGHDKVLILSMRSPARSAAEAQTAPADERAARARATAQREQELLRESGAEIKIVGPDAASAEALALRIDEPLKLAEIAETAMQQGRKDAAELAAFWR